MERTAKNRGVVIVGVMASNAPIFFAGNIINAYDLHLQVPRRDEVSV